MFSCVALEKIWTSEFYSGSHGKVDNSLIYSNTPYVQAPEATYVDIRVDYIYFI
jgi:hypothetical protein